MRDFNVTERLHRGKYPEPPSNSGFPDHLAREGESEGGDVSGRAVRPPFATALQAFCFPPHGKDYLQWCCLGCKRSRLPIVGECLSILGSKPFLLAQASNGSSPIQRLNGGFFIDTENSCVLRRLYVKPDDRRRLGLEIRIVAGHVVDCRDYQWARTDCSSF